MRHRNPKQSAPMCTAIQHSANQNILPLWQVGRAPIQVGRADPGVHHCAELVTLITGHVR